MPRPCQGLIAGTVLLVCLACIDGSAQAQVKRPAPPENYDTEFRYRLRLPRDERIRAYDAMVKYLASLAFVEQEREDADLDAFDFNAERMSGTVPSKNAAAILQFPGVQTVLLWPSGTKPFDDPTKRLRVNLQLAGGFGLKSQKLFFDQVKARLARYFGYSESIGYDHEGYTILRGTLPASRVRDLLDDLRYQPAGWVLTEEPLDSLPEPLRSAMPIRLIQVVEELNEIPAIRGSLPPIPADKPHYAKLAPELRRLLADDAARAGHLRVELILTRAPQEGDPNWPDTLYALDPKLDIEGRVGPLVTVTAANGEFAADLARLPNVLHIRLPRSGLPQYLPIGTPEAAPLAPKKDESKDVTGQASLNPRLTAAGQHKSDDPFVLSRLAELHRLGARGKGVRVLLLDSDFAGWRDKLGSGLPKDTRFLDMTGELDPEMKPLPEAAGSIGHGTHAALILAKAAPEASLTLIRVADTAPHQAASVARYVIQPDYICDSLRIRRVRYRRIGTEIDTRFRFAEEEYRRSLDDFRDSDEAREFRRSKKEALEKVRAEAQALVEASKRLDDLQLGLKSLLDAQVIVNMPAWDVGQPLEGIGFLSKELEELLVPSLPSVVQNQSKRGRLPVWIQAGGDAAAQGWMARFTDADDNQVMDFVAPTVPLPKDRWTRELNFLSFVSHDGKVTSDLPANARVRLSIQWREPHDPDLFEQEESYYREPLVPLKLYLLHQVDPNGTKRASDDFDVIAVSDWSAARLAKSRISGAYEQTIEAVLPAAGRYAIRVEGQVPTRIRPEAATVDGQTVRWELYPRLFVESLDEASRKSGRVIFGDFATALGGVAAPADSLGAIAVGPVGADGRPIGSPSIGSGPTTELTIKPDVGAYAELPGLGREFGPVRGSRAASAFAGGLAASLISGGAPRKFFLDSLGVRPGHLLVIPESWLRYRRE